MNIPRRRFLGALAAVPLVGGACRKRPPRYLVQVVLAGGFDPVLTVDPKDPEKVGAGIDCEYRRADCLAGKKRLYGPLIGGLLRHEAELTLVHGVQVNTVDHGDGLRRLYTGSRYRTDGLGDQIGAALGGAGPITHLDIDTTDVVRTLRPQIPRQVVSLPVPEPRGVMVAAGTATRLAAMAPSTPLGADWFDDLLALQRAEADTLLGGFSGERHGVKRGIQRTRALKRLLTSIRPVPGFVSGLGDGLAVALAAIEGKHGRFIRVSSPRLLFDSHSDNLAIQTARLPPVMADLAHFIDELKRRRNAFGTLWDATTLVVCSEIGRFPRKNAAAGKDHWPETAWILAGRGIRPGTTIGATDGSLVGLPIDYRTGRPRSGGRPLVIEALSATLLQVAGADLGQLGYQRDQLLDAAIAG